MMVKTGKVVAVCFSVSAWLATASEERWPSEESLVARARRETVVNDGVLELKRARFGGLRSEWRLVPVMSGADDGAVQAMFSVKVYTCDDDMDTFLQNTYMLTKDGGGRFHGHAMVAHHAEDLPVSVRTVLEKKIEIFERMRAERLQESEQTDQQ